MKCYSALALVPFALIVTLGCRTEDEPKEPLVMGFIEERLASHRQFDDVLAMADEARLKIELAIVTERPDGSPSVVRHSFDAGPEYFYPASTVKTCAAIAAALQLRELEENLRIDGGLGLDTPLRFEPLFEGETAEASDPSHLEGGTITLGHDIRKVFLVSDNAAYNHLYEFAGNAYLNDVMQSAGLTSARIFHRLSEFRSPADQLRTPRIELLRDGTPIAAVPQRSSGITITNQDLSGTSIGVGYTRGDELVDGPMSFLQKNYITLRDLQDVHIMLLRPDIAIPGRSEGAGFPLGDGDRAFMAKVLAETPGASVDPVYDSSSYPDDYSKFLAPGVWRVLGKDDVTIRDKVGRAYGFSTTNSEVTDHRTGRSFFLAATIYLNPNGILNDGVYDYPRADEFFEDLGEVISREVFAR